MPRWKKKESEKWINFGRGVGTRALSEGGKPGIGGDIIHMGLLKKTKLPPDFEIRISV